MPKKLSDVKPGDLVVRNMCGLEMTLKVTAVSDKLVTCGSWTFSKETGGEVDEDLDWDGLTHTGSFIEPVQQDVKEDADGQTEKDS